jgi:hypothetical protein
MRWELPKDGEKRKKTKFLWFPMTIDDETRWLERTTWIEKYYNLPYYWGWRPYEWIDEDEET